jgi:hypothetical protein
MVFKPNATSTRWGVKHLGKTVASTELFTDKVFTMEVLKQLDENVIKDKFKLPDLADHSDILDSMADEDLEDNGASNEQE